MGSSAKNAGGMGASSRPTSLRPHLRAAWHGPVGKPNLRQLRPSGRSSLVLTRRVNSSRLMTRPMAAFNSI